MKSLEILYIKVSIITLFILVFIPFCFSQGPMMAPFDEGMPSGSFDKEQQEWIESLKGYSQQMYEYEKELYNLQKKIMAIVKQYRNGEITKKEARDKILPLVKEQVRIRSSEDYQAESMTSMFLMQASYGQQGY